MPSNNNLVTDLNAVQRSILRTAIREGYFGVPREISLVDVAEANGVSDREASEQLRSGVDRILREKLDIDSPRTN